MGYITKPKQGYMTTTLPTEPRTFVWCWMSGLLGTLRVKAARTAVT